MTSWMTQPRNHEATCFPFPILLPLALSCFGSIIEPGVPVRLKLRSPRRSRPAPPRSGFRAGAALLLALLLLNLMQLQARPSESALADLHARGACACCDPDPAQGTDLHAPVEETCCASPAAATAGPDLDSRCGSPAPAHVAEVQDPLPNQEAGCCDDGHDSCHCRQAAPGMVVLQPEPVLMPLPFAQSTEPSRPALPLPDGALAPPEQPPRA
jgi:hypothetical protein